MVPLAHGPHNVARQANQEVVAKENDLQAIEHGRVPEVNYPEPALGTRSSRGRASSSLAAHEASFYANLTAQESQDSMARIHQRMDSQDLQLQEIKGQIDYIISWIHSQGILSFTPQPPLDAQQFILFMFLCLLIWIDHLLHIFVSRTAF